MDIIARCIATVAGIALVAWGIFFGGVLISDDLNAPKGEPARGASTFMGLAFWLLIVPCGALIAWAAIRG